MGDLYKHVSAEDLHSFGLIPEFIGRLPVVTSTELLSEGDLVAILTEPKNCLVNQYRALFDLDGVELEFTPGALAAMARLAMQRESGARGLSSIMEETLSELMFEIPSEKNVERVVVTAEAVTGEGEPRVFLFGETTARSA